MDHDVRAKQPIHDRIAKEIDDFQKRNGKIEVLAPGAASRPIHDGKYYGKNRKAVPQFDDEDE